MANISTDFSTWSGTAGSNQPDSGDTATVQADLQAIQAALRTIFPSVNAAVTPTHTELNYVDGVTSAIQTQLNAKVSTSGATFVGAVAVPDDAYAVGWNGSANVPTKNAVYDKIETLAPKGAITSSGLTVATDKLLGRDTAGTGSVEEISIGTGLTLSSGALSVSGALALTFTSSNQTITAAGTLTLAHSMGVTPKLYQAYLVNVSGATKGGYVASAEVPINISTFSSSAAESYGMGIVGDSTNITIRYGAQTGVFVLNNFTTGIAFVITPADWNLKIIAWA
jgi:hypothetical protein